MTPMQRIDLKAILQRTVSGLYGDLVTRPTGQAVRGGVEEVLARIDGEQVAVIDFTTVRCLDFSCADEIVGKLLVQHGRVRFFLLAGVSESHREAIESVLERHGLAVVAWDREGRLQLLGPLDDLFRRAFSVLSRRGTAGVAEIAEDLAIPMEAAHDALESLLARRLVQFHADRYAVPAP
jgi:hypothetical protein